ncbi:unnamed protein product [Caenorhabditis angaria]|uniref:Beta-lactamase-related domain-containing protein n=1 Tax=Caenorhabditis angaria TaxID=860376 RepID=A0A9P1J3Q8_9PELO|nr:unnamed protein product [Caenorhabditis angaria]
MLETDDKIVEFPDGGFTYSQFTSVNDVFRKNFADNLEPAGASFAVYYKDKLIINLFGGSRDLKNQLNWNKDTRTVIFSTTKSISAIILAHTLDRNNVSYDTKISSFWPEFGKHGKENVTILDAVLHRGRIPYDTTSILTREDVLNPQKMSEYFENMEPVGPEGSIIYHALAFGYICDQIVRRIDKEKRGIVEILENDFVQKYGIDNLSIGLKNIEDNENVAQLTDLTMEEASRQGETQEEAYRRWMAGDNEHNEKLYKNFPFITTDDYNVLENRLLPMPSNLGIANAQSLAHFHSLVTNHKILSEKFIKILEKPVLENAFDLAIGYTENKGYGFQYTKNIKDQWIFGHSGYGGQNVRMDVSNGLTFAYVSNGLKISDADMVTTWKNLIDETYRVFFNL